MAWYWWLLIIVGGLVVLISLSSWAGEKRREERQKAFLADISTWKVGDRLKCSDSLMSECKGFGQDYPLLVKWSESEVLVDLGEKGYNRLIKHYNIYENIDDTWRDRHARMDKFMSSINAKGILKKKKQNEAEGIESKMDVEVDSSGNIKIDGQYLTGMAEIYLNIYLQYAMEEGNNSLAEKIREELKKHR